MQHSQKGPGPLDRVLSHRYVTIKGINIFYREAGREGAPVVLLPHGYPCSSFEFRNFMSVLADGWRLLAQYFANPTQGFRDEFLNDVREEVAERIPPDLWKLHWPLMNTPTRREIAVSLMEGLKQNLEWFPRYQAYLREHQPPTLIVWGPQDGYMPEGSARAYVRDLPDAELHLVDGGHWALETNLDEVVALARRFLSRVHTV